MKELFQKPINRTNDSIKWINQTNPNALPFSIADADYQTAPVIIEALIKRINEKHFGYSVIRDDFIGSIVSWYQNRYQAMIKPEWIIPLPDVLIAIKVAIEAFTNENDSIVIQPPVYHRFSHLIKISKRQLIENKLINNNGHYEIDFDDLEHHFKKKAKMLILCSPHNPVGRVWSKEELQKIIDLCLKYRIYLISDEIHGDLINPYKSFLSITKWHNDYAPFIICSSSSKTFNLAGLRTGYAIIPELEIRKKYQEQISCSCIPSINLLGMVATTAAYTKGGNWVNCQNEHLANNYEILKSFIKNHLPNVFVTPLEGTYLCWLDFTYYQLKGVELVELFSKHGVTVSNGASFGIDYEGFIRFNIACPTKQLVTALNLIKEALKKR